MKSFFTKLGTLLLCGVAVAVVGCTDFQTDIQAVDKKVDNLTQNTETDLATINKALKDLEAKITADFATKKEVADLKATLEGSLASQVEALTGQINDVNDALKAAESKVNAAVAELDSKKADKTAVDAAIADAKAAAEKAVTELQGKLEAAQAELEKEIEGVTAEIADVQKNLDEAKAELEKKLAEGDAALQEDIDQAHAKADQLFGQLEALVPYLETLQAQILENKGTLDALSAYLPELKAELEEEIDNVDAKALELKNDLLSLTAHLKEYEAANDAKVLELKGTLDALSAHLGEYEKTTDAKLTELQNTFFALSAYLEEQFAAIEAADDAIYEEIASNFAATNSAITALNNLLEDLQGEMKAADDAIYEEIASNFATTNNAITALNNLLEDLAAEYKAADDAIYAEMAANFATTNEAISSVYAQHLELAARVDGIDASLKAQIAAFEAFKAAYEEKVAELEATDTDLYGQYATLQEAISAVNNLIEDLKKEDENLAGEINGVRENLTQLMNSINDRIDSEVEALKADALQKFNGLISIIAANEERMNDRFEHLFGIVAELDERVAANESAIAALQQTVEMLEMWAEAHGSEYNQLSQLVANIYALTGEIEERVGALEVEDGKIYEFIGQTATNLNNLIEDVAADLEELWAEVAANKNECGAAVLALQNLIDDLNKTLTGRIEDLENRLDVAEGKIADLEEQTAELEKAVVALQGAHATLTEQLQNKLTVLDNQIEALQETGADNAAAIAKLQEAHAILTEQLQNKLSVIDDQIEALNEAIEDNKKAIEKNGAAIEANAELIAENAELITETKVELAELQGNFQAFAQSVEMVLTNHASSIESLTDELDGVLEVIEDINADIDGIQEDLAAAIGRIDALEDAVETIKEAYAVLIEGLQNKFGATDKDIADLQDANDALKKALAEEVKKLYDNDQKNLDNLSNRLASHTDKLAKMIYAVEERLGKAEGKIADLEEQTAELEKAVVALQGAHATLTEQLQNKLTVLDNQIADLQESTGDNADAIAKLQEAHATLTEQLQNKLSVIDDQIEALQEAVADNKKAIEENGAAIEDNAELIAENAELITETKVTLAELQGNFQTFAQNVEMVLTNHSSSIESLTDELDGVLEVIEDINADIDDIQEDLTAAIGRIDALEDAVATIQEAYAVLIEGLTNKFGATDKDIADLQDAIDALKKALAEEVKKLYDNDQKNLDNLSNRLADHTDKLAKMIYALTDEVDTIAARVQSLVYVPDYADGKATVKYGLVTNANLDILNLVDVAFVPAKTTLRYKVNSTSATIVDDIVAAYEDTPEILSFDVEGVQVRGASAGNAALEIVGVSKDADGYLAVDVLARNFDKSFFFSSIALNEVQQDDILDDIFGKTRVEVYQLAQQVPGTKGYSAALVLAQADKKTDVASEFTNLVADRDYDALYLAARYNSNDKEVVLSSVSSFPFAKYPYANDTHFIPSGDTQKKVYTTANEPVVQFRRGLEVITCTPEELFNTYGYKVDIKEQRYVVSYTKDGKTDPASKAKDWNDNICSYNTDKFVVNVADEIGSSREVSLTTYAEEDKIKYDQRVGCYLDVVDTYYLEGQSVAVADKVTITKNLVYINFNAVTYDWTLQKAFDLRGDDKTPYAKDIVLYNVKYDNIYDINPLLTSGHIESQSLSLNGVSDDTKFALSNIRAPKAGQMGTANITISKGYKFAAAGADANEYVKTWRVVLNETTDAVVTVKVTLGNYPATVVLKDEVDLKLVPGETHFEGKHALVAHAYDKLGAVNAGFDEDAKVNDLMYAALTDAANTVVNDPDTEANLRFSVANNVDNSFVRLYKSQFEGLVPPTSFTFKREINTWFGVPFHYEITAKPHLPEIALVRSTEYASATTEKDVYTVDLQARIDKVTGIYTVIQSDLAYYLNVTGDVNSTQTVKFEVLEGYSGDIADNEVALDPLEDPIQNHPLLGVDIDSYLTKEEAILTWTDPHTQIKVKATLMAGVYPIHEATLILNVEDPLTFTAGDITKQRIVEADTPVKVYEQFALISTAKSHDGKLAHTGNLINVAADSFENVLTDEIKKAYGLSIKLEKITIVERTANGDVLYDDSKYDWNPTTGILTLKKDDAAQLLNPIVAQIRVTYTHNVHGKSEACSESKDIYVTFEQK